jgi:hypothetical protein
MTFMTNRLKFARIAICLAVAALGCKPSSQLPTAKVRGTVTVDGAPIPSGTVYFSPTKGRGARGKIKTDGTFELTTYQEGDGAIMGEHAVFVIALDGGADEAEQSGPVKSLVPTKYSNPDTSELRFEVKPNEQNNAILKLMK